MGKKLLVMCAVIIGLLVTPTSLPAQATTVFHSVYAERAVDANYTDTTGCIERDAQIHVSQTRTGAVASVFVASIDVCRSIVLSSTGGVLDNLPASVFQIVDRWRSARLQTTFPVSNGPPVTVDMTWTGVGPTTMVRDNAVVTLGDGGRDKILRYNIGDAYRTATLAGTVVQNGRSLLTGLVGSGQLSSYHSAETTRYPTDHAEIRLP